MRLVTRLLCLLLIMGHLLAGCTRIPQKETEYEPSQITLQPYVTSTATQTAPELLDPTAVASPTAESLIYTVVSGDSLSIIALRFGVDLNALIQANPTVNPNAMSIGTRLIIPEENDSAMTGDNSLTGLPTPVVEADKRPDCYQVGQGEVLCFLLVHNHQAVAVSNISGQIILTGSSATFPATCPLDVLPAGESAILVARITNQEFVPDRIESLMTSAIPIEEDDERYATATVSNQVINYAPDHRSVDIYGEITLKYAGDLRILAFARDRDGHVLGFRIWDAADSLPAGTSQPFHMYLHSLGTEIAEISLVAQVRRQ